MRAARLTALGTFDVAEIDEPTLEWGEVLVRSDAVGICRSDLHYFQHGRIGASVVEFPFTLGHETAGTVVAHGPGVSSPAVGTRVAIEPGISCGACDWCLRGDPNLCPDIRFHGSPPVAGALRQHFAHPAELCIPLDDSLSLDDGVMLEPLAIGVHVNRLATPDPSGTVVVLGCGPVGLMALAVARVSGAHRIIAADLHGYRLELAERYGADVCIDASPGDVVSEVERATKGRGAGIVIEATSSPDVPGQAAEMAAPGGTVALIGITDDEGVILPSHEARRKGLTLRWIRRSRNAVHAAMSLATSGRVLLDGLVTHHFALGDIQRGFELVEAYRDDVFKAVVSPNE